MIKKYLFGSSFLMLVISLVVSSCDPVYILDPIDPRLPKYTEVGNNVAGALVNDTLWKSEYFIDLFGSSNEPYLTYSSALDSLSIRFSGEVDGTYKYRNVSFGLKGYGVNSLVSMAKLNGQKITLDGITNAALLDPISENDCQSKAIGQLYLRSVKYNSEGKYVTISGTFGFTYDDPICGKIAVTYGRFDFSIFRFYPM